MSKADAIYDKVQALPASTQAAVLHMVEALVDGSTSDATPSGGLTRKFQELAETWRRETGFFSFMQQRALHPAYQRIIGMGWVVVPLILRELQRQPDHWLWALQAITGEEPARGKDTLRASADAWLNWGRERGLLPDAQG